MKKPYFCIRAVSILAFILLMQTSYAQEVETQQQTNTDVTTVTQVTEENPDNPLLGQVQNDFASRAVESSNISPMQWDALSPASQNSMFKTEKSYNVDMSTGKVNVRVSIATAGPNEIQIPIELSYITGGIKLRDVASWVGLGWNLSAGGKITRVLNRFPDKLDGSLESFLDSTKWTCKIPGREGNFDERFKNNDTQPDLFHFEIPGKSGMFVLDARGNASTIPYQNVKINYDKATKCFEIIDDAGNRYLFNDIETTNVTISYIDNETKYINYESTWNLSSILNIKGEFVDFEYKSLGNDSAGFEETYDYTSYSRNIVMTLHENRPAPASVKYRTEISPLYLTKISWKNGNVEFVSSKGRTDIPEEAYKLDMIKLYSSEDSNKLIKTYKFEYSAFANKSLKLDGINVSTPKSTGYEFFRKFEYFTDKNLPSFIVGEYVFDDCQIDHWGYYNGKTGNVTGIPCFNIVGTGIMEKEIDDRSSSLAHTRANSLKKIWVTGSGYEEFEYELHTSKAMNVVGGLRIKSITTKSDELVNVSQKVRYEYTDNVGATSGVLFNSPHYYHLAARTIYSKYDPDGTPGEDGYGDVNYYIVTDSPLRPLFDLDGSHIRYKRVKELFDNGSSNAYYYTTKEDQPDQGYTSVYNVLNRSEYLNYDKLVEFNRDFAPVNTRFWQRGLLKEKVSHDALGKETYRETYKYNFNAPILKVIKGVFPFVSETRTYANSNIVVVPYLTYYEYISQPIYMKEKKVIGVDVPETITEYVYDDGDGNPSDLDHILLKKTIERSGADKYTTTYKYPLDYTNIYGTEEGNAIKFMRDNHILSAPIEIVKYKGDNVIGGELNIYGTWHNYTNGEITGAIFNLREVKELLIKKPKSKTEFIESMLGRISVDGFKFTYDAAYVTKAKYEYSRSNKISCIQERSQPSRLFLYGNNPDLPIAQITNAEAKRINGTILQEAFYTSFEDSNGRTHARAKTGSKVLMGGYYTDMSQLAAGSYWVSYWQSFNDGVDWELYETEVEVMENDGRQFTIGDQGAIIDEYRIWKKGSQMQTKTYDASFNVTSETDENGKTTYYDYDAFGRLISVSDNNRDTLKKYKYYLKN